MTTTDDALQLTDWRRRVAMLYAAIRDSDDPQAAHRLWRETRDELFRTHPQSPLLPDDPLRQSGLPSWPYDPALRMAAELVPAEPAELEVQTSGDGTIHLHRIGQVHLADLDVTLDVWWLAQYAGGMFIPLRDGTAGARGADADRYGGTSYGGGRYLFDTAKGADLGARNGSLVLDLNFAYHPSCRYNPRWECPLAPPGNTTAVAVTAGERM
jgi:uncharacterized protein (DUF1684 family)